MLLLQIKNNIKKDRSLLSQICNAKKVNERLKRKQTTIQSFQNTKKLIKTNFFYNLNTLEIIKYIVGISFLKKNTIIYITDIRGRLKHYCSAGFIKLNKKQKIKIPLVLMKLTKVILAKVPNLKKIPVAIHLNNISKQLQFFFEPIFKTQFFIIQLASFKTFPHNGCRPKKLKRKKRKKIFFE